MRRPFWVDEKGHRRPTRPCTTPGCDRERVVPLPYTFQHLQMIGWCKPKQVLNVVNWCGHSQDYVAWPEADGFWRLVPLWEPRGPN